MGNRAIVKFDGNDDKVGVYLHWEGGPGSVLGFVKTMADRGWTRSDYGPARLIGVVVEFFDQDANDTGLSIGVFPLSGKFDQDAQDNGVYVVNFDKMTVRQYTMEEEYTEWNINGPDLENEYDRKSFERIVTKMTALRFLRVNARTKA